MTQASPSFATIYERACQHKGGEEKLAKLLPSPLSQTELMKVSEDRFLALMSKSILQAGFNWQVIERKWGEIEAAYFAFNIDTLLMLSDEQWEAYTDDRRVIRNWQKIKAVKENALFIHDCRSQYQGIASLIAKWPCEDQRSLLELLNKSGSRLGGQTAQWFLRRIGKDCFVLSGDVVTTLRGTGLELKPKPSSKRELLLIQDTFNAWHQETGRCMTHLSKIAAFASGENTTLASS